MASYPTRPIKVSAVIAAPANDVFRFVVDTRNDPLWCANVETVDLVTDEPVGIGSRFRFHQHLERPGGSRIQFDVDVELTSLSDNSVTWNVDDRFQERVITMTVETGEGGCRVTQVTKASFKRPPGLARWAYPGLARRTFKRQFRQLADHFADASAGSE